MYKNIDEIISLLNDFKNRLSAYDERDIEVKNQKIEITNEIIDKLESLKSYNLKEINSTKIDLDFLFVRHSTLDTVDIQKEKLQNLLKQINYYIKEFIDNECNKGMIEIANNINNHKKVGLKVFLILIIICSIASLIFMLLYIFDSDIVSGNADKIANIFGLLDFALGALGFVWERIDDLRKTKEQNSLKNTVLKGNLKELKQQLSISIKKSNKVKGNNNFTDVLNSYNYHNNDYTVFR